MGSKKLTSKNGAHSSLTSSQSFTNQTNQSQINTSGNSSRSSNSLRRQSGDRNNNENNKVTITHSESIKKPFQGPSILVTDNSGNGNSTLVHSSYNQEIDNQTQSSNSQQSNETASTSQAYNQITSTSNNNQTNENPPSSSTNKTTSSLNLYKLFSSFTSSGQSETTNTATNSNSNSNNNNNNNRQTTGRSASVSVSGLDKGGQNSTQLIILDGKNVRRASSNIATASSSSNPTLSKSARSPSAGDCSNVQHVSLTSNSNLTSPMNSTPNSLSAVHAGARRKSREYIRRASQVLINLTNLTAPSSNPENNSHGECSRRDSRLVPQITLFHCALQKLPMKDFGSEIRGKLSILIFLI